jgi:hypothetical protein
VGRLDEAHRAGGRLRQRAGDALGPRREPVPKLLILGVVLILFEVSFAKLRLLRIPEFLAASSLVALLAGVAVVALG